MADMARPVPVNTPHFWFRLRKLEGAVNLTFHNSFGGIRQRCYAKPERPYVMPRIDSERSLLLAVRRNIPPLIRRKLDDDWELPTLVTEVYDYNYLSLFDHGLRSVLVLMSMVEVEEIPHREYRLFCDKLHLLLESLEGLIKEEILCSSEILDGYTEGCRNVDEPRLENLYLDYYPKLKSLISKNADISGSASLSALLVLNPKSAQMKRAVATIGHLSRDADLPLGGESGDHGVKTSVAANPHSGDRSSHAKFRNNSEHLKRSQEFSKRMWSTLVTSFTRGDCTSAHGAKFRIRYLGTNANSVDSKTHTLFISHCLNRDLWKMVACEATTQLPTTLPIKEVSNICEVICRHCDEARVLKIIVHGDRIARDLNSSKKYEKLPVTWPTLSLEHILRDTERQQMSIYHRTVLALNLSHTLLQLPAETLLNQLSSRDIFFLFADCKVLEAYNPYLSFPLTREKTTEKTKIWNGMKFPILIALGKVMLEIALDRPVEDSELQYLHHRPEIALYTLAALEQDNIEGRVGPSYICAMNGCMEANRNEDYDPDDDGEFVEPDPERKYREILLDVVGHLEEAKEHFAGRNTLPSKDPNYPLELRLSRSSRFPHSLGQSYTDRTATAHSEAQMQPHFESRKSCRLASESRAGLAASFFKRAVSFYNEHIASCISPDTIRVAILDTGVDCKNEFFKGNRASRMGRRTPFMRVKSFIPDSDTDILGHGTDVAATVLRIAPEADLYIAKISRDLEISGTDQIVEAIKWAVDSCDAHIINMSFGMSQHVEAIEKAIEEAEIKGKLVFAAASNQGGNASRTFPARMDKVLCIHASDGNGNKSGLCPAPMKNSSNFTTLGVDIESICRDGTHVSGTSYSTAVATAFAANILAFVQHHAEQGKLTMRQQRLTFKRTGMRNIFLKMSEDIDGYQYVAPWVKVWAPRRAGEDVLTDIRGALGE